MTRREEHDLGLEHDLPLLLDRRRRLDRRRALGLLGGTSLAAFLAACGLVDVEYAEEDSGGGGAPATGSRDRAGESSVAREPEQGELPPETGGPFPGDGSNGPNLLNDSGIVRSDITRSFGGPKGVAGGVPMTLTLTVLDQRDGTRTPYRGAAIYVWQCDAKGRYSLYDPGVVNENYLRGVQVADDRGRVTFRSIFPAAYSRRWPHVHFEVFESREAAARTEGKVRTSQLALPEQACRDVYATSYYALSRPNFAQMTLKTDSVFADGADLQLAAVTGSVEDGLTASLTVAV